MNKLLFIVLVLLSCRDNGYIEKTSALERDSVWIYRVAGSRHRILTNFPTYNFKWYESRDRDSFYLVSNRRDLVFKLDRFYYGMAGNMVSDTTHPCQGLTAYFDYIPDPDDTEPFMNRIRPRIAGINNCNVDQIQWFIQDSLTGLGPDSFLLVKPGFNYKLIYYCNYWGCSDTLDFEYNQSPNYRLSIRGDSVKLIAPLGLERSDVDWYVKGLFGGWGLSTGSSYRTYSAKTSNGYRYYARIRTGDKTVFTNSVKAS